MIDILLPVYNGAKYLEIQIDSLFKQTYMDWRLIVRDDGSTDSSVDIIERYVLENPGKILYVKDSFGNLGTSGCLNILLQYIEGDYFMYCDQDDIWSPFKIERSLEVIKSLEKELGNVPILVCSDAYCINSNGTVINNSFFKSQKFLDVTDNYIKMAALNVVQGSTSLMNRRVKDTIKYIPKEFLHDGWTAVITAYYGHVEYIHEPLLYYRQHESNVLGAHNIGILYYFNKIKHFKKQINLYSSFFDKLPFKVNKLKWLYYKSSIAIKRIL